MSTFSAIEYGKLHYREIEKEKSFALKRNKGNYEAVMNITQNMKLELKWWFTNIQDQQRKTTHGNPEITIQTDASLVGWEAVSEGCQIGGRLSEIERGKHINALELKAILFALKAFSEKIVGKHIKVLTGNSTAVSSLTTWEAPNLSCAIQLAKKFGHGVLRKIFGCLNVPI